MFRFAGRFRAVAVRHVRRRSGRFGARRAGADPAGLLEGRVRRSTSCRPGRAAAFSLTPNSSDQIPLYDGLTPKRGNVTAADLPQFFKKNVFGLGGLSVQSTRTFPGRPGLVDHARQLQRPAHRGAATATT